MAWIASLIVTPLAAEGQQRRKLPLVGYLSARSGPGDEDEAFRQGLRELGYIPGRDIVIEYRWAAISNDGLRLAAEELVRLKVDVLVGSSGPAVQAAKTATTTIPIVIQAAADPVGSGFIASLARPGGNITGLSLMIPDLAEKQLELLRTIIPKLSRVAYMAQAASTYGPQLQQAQAAAEKVGVHLQPVMVNDPEGFEEAFASIRGRAEALWVQPIFNTKSVQKIHDLALRERLPTVSSFPLFAQTGLMLSYGPNHLALPRRAAVYVDKILKGAKPADLPVEQPTKLELVINLKTAKALGLTIPQSLLLRADQVIQ